MILRHRRVLSLVMFSVGVGLVARPALSETCASNCASEKTERTGWSSFFAGKKKCYETLPQVSLFDATLPAEANATSAGPESSRSHPRGNDTKGTR